jgi:hypothetical protein
VVDLRLFTSHPTIWVLLIDLTAVSLASDVDQYLTDARGVRLMS